TPGVRSPPSRTTTAAHTASGARSWRRSSCSPAPSSPRASSRTSWISPMPVPRSPPPPRIRTAARWCCAWSEPVRPPPADGIDSMPVTASRSPNPRRIVLLAGPSGSGKGELSRRSGLPVLPLDEFYRDHDAPGLPRRYGIVDWDDPSSWDAGAALEALTSLAHDGSAEVPVYSIAESRRLGTGRL